MFGHFWPQYFCLYLILRSVSCMFNVPFTDWTSESSYSYLFLPSLTLSPLSISYPTSPPFLSLLSYSFLLFLPPSLLYLLLPFFSAPFLLSAYHCSLQSMFVQRCQAGHLMGPLRKKTDAALDLQGLRSDERDRTWANPLQHVQTKCSPGHQETSTLVFQRKCGTTCRAGWGGCKSGSHQVYTQVKGQNQGYISAETFLEWAML